MPTTKKPLKTSDSSPAKDSSAAVLGPKLDPNQVSLEATVAAAIERSQLEQRSYFRDLLQSFAQDLKSSTHVSSKSSFSSIQHMDSDPTPPVDSQHSPSAQSVVVPVSSPSLDVAPRPVLSPGHVNSFRDSQSPALRQPSPPPHPSIPDADRHSSSRSTSPLSSAHAFVPPVPKPVVTFNIAKWTKEVKDLSLSSDTFDTVCSWYDTLQQSMIIATERSDILPELDQLSPTYNFAAHILPHSTSSVYQAALASYTSMAKALRIYIMKPSSIHSHCVLMIEKRKINQFQRDGFVLLLNILGGVFPHMGGPQLDVIAEISSLVLSNGETLDSLLLKFIDMDRKLILSGHSLPPTALINRYLTLIRGNERIFTIISPIHREFHAHMLLHGPDVRFASYSFTDVHDYIKYSGVACDTVIHDSSNMHAGAASVFLSPSQRASPSSVPMVIPQSSAAVLSPPSSNDRHRPLHSSRGRPSIPRCPICFQRHHPIRCWSRGEKFQPIWLRRNVQKYNALHPKDVVEDSYLNQPPPLRFPQANKVSFDSGVDCIQDSASTTSLTVFHEDIDVATTSTVPEIGDISFQVDPTCNMADASPYRVSSPTPTAEHSFVEC